MGIKVWKVGLVLLIIFGCGRFLAGQTAPANQLARHAPRKKTKVSKETPPSIDMQIAKIKQDYDRIAKAKAAVAAVAAATVAPVAPAVAAPLDLRVVAARALANASSVDADAYAKQATSALSVTPLTEDAAKVAESSAIYAEQVVEAAALADDFNTLAKAETDPDAASIDAQNAAAATDLAHQAWTLYLEPTVRPPAHATVEQYPSCAVADADSNGYTTYSFAPLAPLWRRGCNDAAVMAYYNVGKAATVGNQAQYLYNPAQSTNQVNADLLTTTFSGGVQVVLAGTATAGSAQPAGSSGTTPSVRPHDSTTTPTTTTDSVATAISKLEQGGDFNLRASLPLIAYRGPKTNLTVTALPNVGFAVNGLSSQSTITQSTNYVVNIPFEAYAQFSSIPNMGTAAVIYVDAKPAGEFLPQTQLATNIGTGRAFFLMQLSAGISFSNSVRVGFQYYVGPSQAYCVPASTAGCTPVTGTLSGAHLVVSFTPPSSK